MPPSNLGGGRRPFLYSINPSYREIAVLSSHHLIYRLPGPGETDRVDSDPPDFPPVVFFEEAMYNAYRFIQSCFREPHPSEQGYSFKALVHCRLSYHQLLYALRYEQELWQYFEDNFRREWDVSRNAVTLRRRTPGIHNTFESNLTSAIRDQLEEIRVAHRSLRPLLGKLKNGGRAAVSMNGRNASTIVPAYYETTPDGQLLFSGERYPPFIFRVSYRETEKEAKEQIEQLFKMMGQKIVTVLHIKINYLSSEQRNAGSHHGGIVSIWNWTECNGRKEPSCDRKIFRSGTGNTRPGTVIIPIQDLLPFQYQTELPPRLADSVYIQLSHSFLSELLQNVEANYGE
ncbi:hypothetical protein NUW58_g7031 [Xylaria curta]|uniref:Uncharacterized protein n=1 Tax=Xylaria curta TaxID=42375 RepID=A0ACC1NLC4_9PEZI|nr:hypothetical protein NUW58_g7031 [Xylaria curta]